MKNYRLRLEIVDAFRNVLPTVVWKVRMRQVRPKKLTEIVDVSWCLSRTWFASHGIRIFLGELVLKALVIVDVYSKPLGSTTHLPLHCNTQWKADR